MGQVCPTQLICSVFCRIGITYCSIVRYFKLMITRNFCASFPEMVFRNHRATVFMELCISFSSFWIIRSAGQRQTYNLPSVLVEQNKHRLDFRWYKLERLAHLDGLEDMLFFTEFLTGGRCLTRTTIIIMYPWLRVCPSFIYVPRY